jgi:hypothetical protein
MNDAALYQRLGEVIGELKGTNAHLGALADKIEGQEKRLKSLEETRATAKGSLAGMKWLAQTAFIVASALGAERIVQLVTGWHV